MSEILNDISGLEDVVFQLRDRRKHERKSFRTVGEVHSLENNRAEQPTKVWTHDVSVSGARLVTKQPLPEKRFLLALIMPPMSDTILECEVVKTHTQIKTRLNGSEERSLVYCVKFIRKAARSEIQQVSLVDQTEIDLGEVVQNLGKPNTPSRPEKSLTPKKQRRSFLPFLSMVAMLLHAII